MAVIPQQPEFGSSAAGLPWQPSSTYLTIAVYIFAICSVDFG